MLKTLPEWPEDLDRRAAEDIQQFCHRPKWRGADRCRRYWIIEGMAHAKPGDTQFLPCLPDETPAITRNRIIALLRQRNATRRSRWRVSARLFGVLARKES